MMPRRSPLTNVMPALSMARSEAPRWPRRPRLRRGRSPLSHGNHNRHGRCEAERARACNDEHGDRVDERVSHPGLGANCAPHDESDDGHGGHDGNEVRGDGVRELLDRRAASLRFDHQSVDGSFFSRTNPQAIVDVNGLERNVLLASVLTDATRGLGRQTEKLFDRRARSAACMKLQNLAQQDQCDDHACRIEVHGNPSAV